MARFRPGRMLWGRIARRFRLVVPGEIRAAIGALLRRLIRHAPQSPARRAIIAGPRGTVGARRAPRWRVAVRDFAGTADIQEYPAYSPPIGRRWRRPGRFATRLERRLGRRLEAAFPAAGLSPISGSCCRRATASPRRSRQLPPSCFASPPFLPPPPRSQAKLHIAHSARARDDRDADYRCRDIGEPQGVVF